MRRRPHAAFLSMMVAASIHRREGDPRQPRRIQIDVNEEDGVLEQHVTNLSPPFPTAAEARTIPVIPDGQTMRRTQGSVSPVRLIDGR